ncbi:MAG TPA: FUN14 domain-containing protein [Candidatus Babeliales bacterium]|nr:FUN14 domain-containing protein [Candidatus Babeliales bacterium]
MAQTGQPIQPEPGVLDTLKENLSPSKIMQKLNLTPNKLLELTIYFGVGIIVGYLLKKYGKYVIVIILGILIVLLLQQLGVLTIIFNSDKFHELFGMQPTTTAEGSLLAVYGNWVKANIALVLSFSIGFILGLRMG